MNAKAYEIIVNPLCDLAASTNVYIIYSEWNCRNRTVLSNPCLWSGVYCNGNEVVELVITSVKLRGTIPSALGCLTGLQTLDFSNNLIAGSIPSNFGQLINLQYLLLQENLLVSSVPSTLGNLTNLFYLSLYDNLLTSTIPSTLIAISNSVKYFYIFNNFLTSSIPAFLGVYSRAITIRFEENYFSSTLPSQLCNLSRLEYLRLNDNLLTSSLPTCLFSITSLQYLNLAYNAFTGSIPSTVHNCKSLIFLVLNNNQIGGQPPLSLCALSTLTGLYIGNNQFKCHPYCQSDVNWTSETAGYRCQDFQDEIMYSLQQNLDIFSALSRVVYTDKRTIVYSEGTLRYYSYTRAFQYLLVLNFAYFHADNRCLLLNICADAACNEIIFSWNDTSPPIFPIRRSSFYVDCPLCDLCPGWQIGYDLTVHSYADSNWAFLPTVPYNSTSNSTSRYARGLCQKAWSGIQCERGLVTSIQLPSLGLSGTLPTSIGLLSGLSALDFASNGIKGSIPTTMALLKSLNTLVLTNNHVIGQIPSQFSALENLVFLDAGYNSLTGSIPTYFYSMSQLAVIYLDGNSYNGQVSSVLCEYVVQKNVTVSMKYSPVLVCYQESCWSDHPALREKFMDNYLPACSPTHFPTSSLPTSQPTRTTQSQITVSPALSPSNIAIITCTVGGCFLFVIISIVWRRLMSEKATVRRRRTQRLEELPVHRALIARPKLRESEWMELVETHLHTVRELDADGNTAIEILLQGSNPCVVPGAAIALLLEDSLPPLEDGPSTAQRGRELDSNAGDVESDFEAVYEDRGMVVRRAVSTHAWALAVQHDAPEVAQAIERVLDRHKLHIHALANACDKKGRCCKYIAQPRIKTAMLTRLYLHRRYELKPGPALHKSATSLVIQARDHGSQLNDLNGDLENDGNKVVLKFMRNRDHFLREVGARLQGDFDERFVLPLLECYDKDSTSDDNVAFRLDATSKGFEEYPYCVVMEAASFNLKHVIDQQLIAANDWEQIKQISRQLAQCLDHLHSKGVIHGDFKPLNVLQVGLSLKLIDLDCAVVYKDNANAGLKYSSAYIPPEMVCRRPDGSYTVRVGCSGESPIRASPSLDMWALGCVYYLLCSGSTLFQATVQDQISNISDFETLYDWSEETKNRKLDLIQNKLARNMVSMLLNKIPMKRPTASRLLQHPFFTGRNSVRMMGDAARWDVFISYRVDSDFDIANLVYEKLTTYGLRVWWDKRCLLPGQNWESGFCSGLVDSSNLVCILSRNGINNPKKQWMNFETLEKTSKCDNVFWSGGWH